MKSCSSLIIRYIYAVGLVVGYRCLLSHHAFPFLTSCLITVIKVEFLMLFMLKESIKLAH